MQTALALLTVAAMLSVGGIWLYWRLGNLEDLVLLCFRRRKG